MGAQDADARAHTGAVGSPLAATRTAMEQLATLTGLTPEGMSKLQRADDGWSLCIEVVELDRIPPTTSVLGSYQVRTDRNGNVESYERVRRYCRNQTEL